MAPTTGRIFPLCQPFARRTDQQPKAIARKIAPRNLTASSFTGQGQRPIDWLGSTKKVAPMRRLISERMSRKRREYLPRTLGRNSDIAIHWSRFINKHVAEDFATISFREFVRTASVNAILLPRLIVEPSALRRPLTCGRRKLIFSSTVVKCC